MKADGGSPHVGVQSRRPLDLGAGAGSSHLTRVAVVHLCQEQGNERAVCPGMH